MEESAADAEISRAARDVRRPASQAALAALSALGQESRLAIFRALVAAGPRGLTATAAAKVTAIRANTFSAHIAILARAGLVRSRRDGRSIVYMADLGGVRGIVRYLMQDCCGGHPELCTPLFEDAEPGTRC